MDDDQAVDDAAHGMETVLRYSQRAQRFGREVRDDRPEPRTDMETNDAGKPNETSGYMVDPSAVAAAIIDRLVAGRTLPRPR